MYDKIHYKFKKNNNKKKKKKTQDHEECGGELTEVGQGTIRKTSQKAIAIIQRSSPEPLEWEH